MSPPFTSGKSHKPLIPAKIQRFSPPAGAFFRSASTPRRPTGLSSKARFKGIHAHFSANHPDAAILLGQQGLRASPADRHGSRRGHLARAHVPARHRPGTLAFGVRPAVTAAQGRPLRRQPKPSAALLPVSSGAETRA